MKRKVLLSILIFVLLIILINPGTVQAALQANGGSPASYNLETWLRNVRNMEALGGTLGLQDTINSTNLTSSASEKNNIDIHMEKNTEYGAMAILSASSYGNQNKIADGQTTTGNKTGVYIKLNKEWVAAGTIARSSIYQNANTRYKNIYTANYIEKKGDAITETAGWHESNASTWLSCSVAGGATEANNSSGLVRAYSGSLFSYYGDSGGGAHGSQRDAYYLTQLHSRAVIVCGNGF